MKFSTLLHSYNALISTRRYTADSSPLPAKVEISYGIFNHEGAEVLMARWRVHPKFKFGIIEAALSVENFIAMKGSQLGLVTAVVEHASDHGSRFFKHRWHFARGHRYISTSVLSRAEFTALTGQPS